MILHRLRLTDFRGVTDRELSFPDHGVVVVCGPNEIGKSSMLEALDLLLTYKDRSTHRDVKQVKPSHADVGARVETEISTGPYRFVYRKRFHKKQLTELDILEPKREQLTGDEAHERVGAMLAETMDTRLWDAQRVLQSSSTEAVTLSGSDALSRALDAAAGEAATAPSGTESLLIDCIDAEYLKYFTATGRPTRDWKTAIDRVKEAEAEVARCAAAVADVDERVRRHEELSAELQALSEGLAPAAERVTAAQQAHTVVGALAEQVRQARLEAKVAAATSANSALANGQRLQFIDDAARRAETLTGLQDQLVAAEQQVSEARQAAEAATEGAVGAAAARAGAQQRLDAARDAQHLCTAREQVDRLASRLKRIEDTAEQLAVLTGQLAVIPLADEVLDDIEKASALVERLDANLQAEAGTVEFTALADLEITVDGAPHTLTAGLGWTRPAESAVLVEVPGVLSVRIDPGATASRLRADLQAAQQVLREALHQGGVPDLAAAQAIAQQRRGLEVKAGKLATALEVLIDGEDIERLRVLLGELRGAVAEVSVPVVDADGAAVELTAADQALNVARTEADAAGKLADSANAALAEKAVRTTVLRDKLQTAAGELTVVVDQLVTLRAAVADAEVAAQATAGCEALRRADTEVAALVERYAAADPDAVERELAEAAKALEAVTGEHEAATLELNNLTVELGLIGTEGRQGRLADAEAALEGARTEHARIEERANAARLLRDTMARHRDNTRKRYVEPYRKELERLGREVFGASFEVDVDTELTIQTRTLDGCTVPYSSLSGGAKEQLGILARLAGAALVAKEDTVPVVIDDALGFSDPDRLVRMGAVLNTVGDRGQVIVLTCTPGRYDGVADAEVIELSA